MSTGELIVLALFGPLDLAFLVLAWRHRSSLDRMITTGVNRWLLARHKPEDIGDEGTPKPWCFVCRKSWPCPEWENLHAEVRESGVEWKVS